MLTMVNPIDFGGHSSKVKVTMGIIDKYGVRRDATLCVVIFIMHSQCMYLLYCSANQRPNTPCIRLWIDVTFRGLEDSYKHRDITQCWTTGVVVSGALLIQVEKHFR